MSEERFLWLLVFFDLPTKELIDRKRASRFRKDLIKMGFDMMQLSVYIRPVKGFDALTRFQQNIKRLAPNHGQIKLVQFTDIQFARIKTVIGEKKPVEETGLEKLLVFD